MKKLTLLLLAFVALGAQAQISIEMINQYPFDRENQIVEIKTSEIGPLKADQYVLRDESNQEVPYQLIYDGKTTVQSIVFPVTIKTGTKVVYTLNAGKPAPVTPLTHARQVPERKDDFAWENDIAAYRMYGPALAKENPSNGVDLWLKRTSELVVDSFYFGDLNMGRSYHVDHGKGLDCYKVGNTLGAGGVGAYTDTTLWVGTHYNSFKVLENGPLRSVFVLTYDTLKVNGKKYKQTLKITVDAGAVLNKAEVKLVGPAQNMQLATGIYLHDPESTVQKNTVMMLLAEKAVSDAGVEHGQNYVAVLIPEKGEFVNQGSHALLLSDYKVGTDFHYYFGGGWSEWKFPTLKEWLAAVQQHNKQEKYPLKITVVK